MLDQKLDTYSQPDDKADDVVKSASPHVCDHSRPPLNPPSYSAVLAKDELALQEVQRASSLQIAPGYTQWLHELQKNLKKYKKEPAKQLRERIDASDASQAEGIVAQEIARLVGSNREETDDLSRYSCRYLP